MRSIGSALLFFGIGSAVLYMIDYEFIILSWIENWGDTVAWIIRGAMVALGVVLYVMGGGEPDEEEEPQEG